MKKILLLSVALLGLGFQVLAKKNVTTENRSVAAFSKVVSDGKLDLVLTQGSADSVCVETEDEWQKDVSVEVDNGTLKLSTSKKLGQLKLRNKVYVTFKNLSELRVDGVGNVESANAITGEQFTLNVHGVSKVKLQLEVKQANMNLSGVGNVKLRGKVEQLELKNSSVGNMDAEDLKAEKANVINSGVGNVEVYASKELAIINSGVGNVTYSGAAVITSLNSSGVGRIKHDD